jgi:tetratricopeptide (TPR) repeat protein
VKKTLALYLICFSTHFIACQGNDQQENLRKAESSSLTPELEQLNTLLESNPDEADLWFQRAQLYYEMEKYPQAVSDLEKAIRLDSTVRQYRHLLADAYLDNYESRKALETMEKTVKLFPESISSLLKLSEFQLILKRYPDAMNTLNRIHKIAPQNADAYFMKGLVIKETGDTSQAIGMFQSATKENPRLIDAWINLGQLHEALNDQDAIRYFDGGLSVSPDHPLLLHAKAQYLAGQDRIEEAKLVYRRWIEVDPLNGDPYYDLGLLYLDQDSLTQALGHFDLAIKINPMYSRAYFYRGYTRELTGEESAARQDYEQTLQLDPEDSDAREALNRVPGNL